MVHLSVWLLRDQWWQPISLQLTTQYVMSMIEISTGDSRPIFKQIVDAFGKKILSGDLSAGSKLPSVRELAMQLTINTNTVAKAYAALADQGLVESRKGLGLFVIERRQTLSDSERYRRLDQAAVQFVNDIMMLNFPDEEINAVVVKKLDEIKMSKGKKS